MRIELNGEPKELPDGITVIALLQRVGTGSGPVAVERNAEIVPRAEHASTVLRDGDRVEVVQFVGGG